MTEANAILKWRVHFFILVAILKSNPFYSSNHFSSHPLIGGCCCCNGVSIQDPSFVARDQLSSITWNFIVVVYKLSIKFFKILLWGGGIETKNKLTC